MDIKYFANTSDDTLRSLAKNDRDRAEYMRLNRLAPIPKSMSAEDYSWRARWYEAEIMRRKEAVRRLMETRVDVLAYTDMEASDEQ